MPLGTPLFLLQLAPTLFLTGLIWFVQIVHYPLFALVPSTAAIPYEEEHARRTGWVVIPPMLLELLTTVAALHPRLRPPEISRSASFALAALLLIVWISTFALQVPVHNRLHRPQDSSTLQDLRRRLVSTNWLRTAAWTGRSALLLAALAHSLTQT